MKYHFKIHKEKKGYWAECIELNGCFTQADSKNQLANNMQEALNVYLNEPQNSKIIFPLPKKRVTGSKIKQVTVEPRVALAFRIRKARLERKLTQGAAAKMLGLRGLYSYQRLESAKTANPEFETIVKIKRAFPELLLDELLAA